MENPEKNTVVNIRNKERPKMALKAMEKRSIGSLFEKKQVSFNTDILGCLDNSHTHLEALSNFLIKE
jgi:hypothetical protein